MFFLLSSFQEDIKRFESVAEQARECAAKETETEESLGDIPDEFLGEYLSDNDDLKYFKLTVRDRSDT